MKTILSQQEIPFRSRAAVLVVSPSGSTFDANEVGDALFGELPWTRIQPPLREKHLAPVPSYLVGTDNFGFDSVTGTWTEFLDAVYDAVDLVLFYSGMGEQYYELPRINLEVRKPDKYTYSFLEFSTEQSQQHQEQDIMAEDMVMAVTNALQSLLSSGWTASAISNVSGVNPITIGNLKKGKAQRVTKSVHDKLMEMKNRSDQKLISPPARGRKAAPHAAAQAAAAPAVKAKPGPRKNAKPGPAPKGKASPKPKAKPGPKPTSSSIINTNYVPVNVSQLQAAIDAMVKNFAGAIAELESIKKQLTK